MSEFKPGLEGIVAFETEIAEPDRDGGALRYRGVDIEDLVGVVPFEKVWGLLVDDELDPGLQPAAPYTARDLTGNAPADLQAVTAHLAGEWGLRQLIDISDDEAHADLARLSATMISVVAQSARVADGQTTPVDPELVASGSTAATRFLLEWRGEADPKHVQALDTYWICTAEHGLNASTFTARVITSAALIMISVFLSFVFGGEPTIKMMGLGLATAVFVDATIIRMILVPATMRLLGDANWWMPRWLDRMLPNLDIEGESKLPPEEFEGPAIQPAETTPILDPDDDDRLVLV